MVETTGMPRAFLGDVFISDLTGDCTQQRQQLAPGYKAIRDSDTGRLISIATNRYKLIQHSDVLSNVIDLVGANSDGIKTRFTKRGANMYIRVKSQLPIIVANDRVRDGKETVFPTITIRNSYIPGKSLLFELGVWQMICSNGAYGLVSMSKSRMVHAGNEHMTIKEVVKNGISYVMHSVEEHERVIATLAGTEVSDDQMKALEENLPPLYYNMITDSNGSATRNAWQLLSRITQYTTHESRGDEYEYGRGIASRFIQTLQLAA